MRSKEVLRSLFVLGLVVTAAAYLTGCEVPEPEDAPPPTENDEPIEEPDEADPEPEPPDVDEPEVDPEPEPVDEASLTAEDLVDTVWQAGPMELAFGADGQLIVNDTEEGTWSLAGPQLTIEAAGHSYTAEVRNDGIYYGGMALQRVE